MARDVHVVIKADTSQFVAELERAREIAAKLAEIVSAPGFSERLRAAITRSQFCRSYEDHRFAHHMPEDPRMSAMHAAYDRRRRARRRNR